MAPAPEPAQPGPPGRSERALAQLWLTKTGRRLKTTDGRTLRVIYPGRPAPGHGPDFRDALVELDGRRLSGPVELHRTPADWTRHGHHLDPAYDSVILHVVNAVDDSARVVASTIPALPTVAIAVDRRPRAGQRSLPSGPFARLRGLDEHRFHVALRRAGLEWFDERTERAAEAIEWAGPDQAMYMAVMDALGFVENRAGFLELAQRLPAALLHALGASVAEPARPRLYRALFVACSGLGPATREWTDLIGTQPMQPGVWRTAGTRPGNHPLRRVAAAPELLARWLPTGISNSLAACAEQGARPLVASLLARDADGAAMIGEGRARQMAANAVLPGLAAQARRRGDRRGVARLAALFEEVPPLPANSLTREAFRLLGDRDAGRLGACEQQGLLHLYRRAVASDGPPSSGPESLVDGGPESGQERSVFRTAERFRAAERAGGQPRYARENTASTLR